jgi:uncharacterized protein YceH (UPF0502 family)
MLGPMSDAPIPVELDLSDIEMRILGALIEKASTTPDAYPLTTKALVNACNQKSSRDPVMAVTETEVDQAAMSLRQRQLTRSVREAGARAPKHRHVVDDTWELSPPQLAVLAVLMLRGIQTPGELRTRIERMCPIDSVTAVEIVLIELANRPLPLAKRIPRGAGEKQDRWQHLVGQPAPDPASLPAPLTSPSAGAGGAAGDGAAVAGGSAVADPPRSAPGPNAIRSAGAPVPGAARPPAAAVAPTPVEAAPDFAPVAQPAPEPAAVAIDEPAPAVTTAAPSNAVSSNAVSSDVESADEVDALRDEVADLRREVAELRAELRELTGP